MIRRKLMAVTVIVALGCCSVSYAQSPLPETIFTIRQNEQKRVADLRKQMIAQLRVGFETEQTSGQERRALDTYSLVWLGKMLLADLQYGEAERFFLQADENETAHTGHHSAAILTNLTRLYMQTGQWQKAEKTLLLQLQAYRREGPEYAFETRYTKARLAEVYLAQNKLGQARQMALGSVYEKNLDHANAEDFLLLGKIEQAARHYVQAQTHLKKALHMLEKQEYKSFSDDETQVKVMQQTANMLAAWGKKEQSAAMRQQANAHARRLNQETVMQEICLMAPQLKKEERLEEARQAMQFCVDRASQLYGENHQFTRNYLQSLDKYQQPKTAP